VLDRETLGAIWAGDITMWNDQRIRDLNPPEVAAKLPAATITLGYNANSRFSVAEVFKVALSSFSERFRTALAAANDSFALMPPALAGNAFEAGKTAVRGAWLKAPRHSTLSAQV
jgi:ABC-type phosphate transport system substrate-binding protein